jgi:outer membrane protein assembly factor BamE
MFSNPALRAAFSLAAAATLAACSTVGQVGSGLDSAINSVGSLVTPYKIEIIQGNVLTKEQVALLQKGLSKEQVRGLLGSPLVTSAFHGDRWDYVFTIERQGVPAQERRYSLVFKGDSLETFGGDAMPNENDFVATLVSQRQIAKAPELKASEEKLRAFAAANTQRAAPAASSTASAAIRTDYPPLEATPVASTPR